MKGWSIVLTSIYSEAFKDHGRIRPPIRFHEGLNVVLGEPDGKNSIGKSSTLLAIDFVFGGDSYLKSDGVSHVGQHAIYFTFTFAGQDYHFARDTRSAEQIFITNSQYERQPEVWDHQKFVNWLKQQYGLDFPGLSFRKARSSFFRIYGKENYDELHPLRGIPGQNKEKSIALLIQLFNRYQEVERLHERLQEQTEKLATFKKARSYNFIPAMVGGKSQYEQNVHRIGELEADLASLTETQAVKHSKDDIQRSQQKAEMQDVKRVLEDKIATLRRRRILNELSLEYGLAPTEADLSALQEFFPDANLRKLYEVENYHKKLAQILGDAFESESQEITSQLEELKQQAQELEKQMRDLGFVGNISREFLKAHRKLTSEIDAIRKQNDAYKTLKELEDYKRITKERLEKAIELILVELQHQINEQMMQFNDELFADKRNAPVLAFNTYNSYNFYTPNDKGTGANFKGLVLYDLAVFALTGLPALAHDSLLFKNIEDEAVAGIMRIYNRATKQIFIAFDKQGSYSPEVAQIAKSRAVLHLSRGGGELYGAPWNEDLG